MRSTNTSWDCLSSPESLAHQTTHKGVSVNWRPCNLEPKPRALTASCPLSTDTLPEHTVPLHPRTQSHNMSCVTFEWIGQQLDMTWADWVMYAYIPMDIHIKYCDAGLQSLLPKESHCDSDSLSPSPLSQLVGGNKKPTRNKAVNLLKAGVWRI